MSQAVFPSSSYFRTDISRMLSSKSSKFSIFLFSNLFFVIRTSGFGIRQIKDSLVRKLSQTRITMRISHLRQILCGNSNNFCNRSKTSATAFASIVLVLYFLSGQAALSLHDQYQIFLINNDKNLGMTFHKYT